MLLATITLATCRAAHHAALTAYRLPGVQGDYSRPPSDWLNGNMDFGTARRAVTVLRDGEPVGFFILDGGNDREDYSANPHAVLLRSMSLNPHYQGNGYACGGLFKCA